MPGKHRGRRLIALFVLAAAAAALPAGADPTDIITVPTAEIQKPGHFQIEGVQDLVYLDKDFPRRTSVLTTFGITKYLEAGVDFNTIGHGDTVEGDLKLQLRDPSKYDFGFAVGATRLSPEFNQFIYGVTTTGLGRFKVTGGVGGTTAGEVRALVGATYPLTSRLTALADWRSGSGGAVSAGLGYKLNRHLSTLVWWQRFNNRPLERIQFDLLISGAFD